MAYHSSVPRIFEAVPLGKFCTEHYWDYSQEGADPQMEAICNDYLRGAIQFGVKLGAKLGQDFELPGDGTKWSPF